MHVFTDPHLLSLITAFPCKCKHNRAISKRHSITLYARMRGVCKQIKETLPPLRVAFPPSLRIREFDSWLRWGDGQNPYWTSVENVYHQMPMSIVPMTVTYD
eukprot:2038567-Pleurochrysis_carterae.AAC.1